MWLFIAPMGASFTLQRHHVSVTLLYQGMCLQLYLCHCFALHRSYLQLGPHRANHRIN